MGASRGDCVSPFGAPEALAGGSGDLGSVFTETEGGGGEGICGSGFSDGAGGSGSCSDASSPDVSSSSSTTTGMAECPIVNEALELKVKRRVLYL